MYSTVSSSTGRVLLLVHRYKLSNVILFWWMINFHAENRPLVLAKKRIKGITQKKIQGESHCPLTALRQSLFSQQVCNDSGVILELQPGPQTTDNKTKLRAIFLAAIFGTAIPKNFPPLTVHKFINPHQSSVTLRPSADLLRRIFPHRWKDIAVSSGDQQKTADRLEKHGTNTSLKVFLYLHSCHLIVSNTEGGYECSMPPVKEVM